MNKSKENEAFKLMFNPSFYKNIGINRKRWGFLHRGEKEPTISELQRIAEYFDILIFELINGNETQIPNETQKSYSSFSINSIKFNPKRLSYEKRKI